MLLRQRKRCCCRNGHGWKAAGVDCKKAEARVIFDEPEDAGILARFAREEPAGYVSMEMRPGGLQDYVNVWNELN